MPEIFPYPQYKGRADVPGETAFPAGFKKNIPIVGVQVRLGTATTPKLSVLVDSGSVFCIFGLDTANLLGINVPSGKLRKNVSGIGGGSIDLYFFDIELLINKVTLNCYAGFMNQNLPGSVWVGILGDHDFLSQIPVALDVLHSEIRIG
jgi:hypothetical protein